ncbi:unnamed protein product [Rotaria sp. Silwood1]|nr:unnamed protein product [Rotaria sp. Silwood1]
MGGGAAVARPTANSKETLNDTGRQTVTSTHSPAVNTLMASLRCYMPNDNIPDDEQKRKIHIIDVINRRPTKIPTYIVCEDLIEFEIHENDEYDIFQVYYDGKDYNRIVNGYELRNISSHTPKHDRRMLLSLDLNQTQSEPDIYFCVIPSSHSQTVSKTRKCPPEYCEYNYIKIKRRVEKIFLTDEQKNQKVYLYKGDTIELKWSSQHGTAYHIEEKKYCPVSGSLYTVEATSDRPSSEGTYNKTFDEFGMSFLFRITDTNQIYDITVCVINDKYKIKYIEITDNNIRPNTIWIERNDWIAFEWYTTCEQTIKQIEPFPISENQQQSTLFWRYEPSHHGYMYHQFKATGIYYYRAANDQIGTIIVQPERAFHHVQIFSDQKVHNMKTEGFVQFHWKISDSQEEPILITIDSKSSVLAEAADGRTGLFDCLTEASIIYQTDEYGNRSEPEQILFYSQQNNINYIMKEFSQLGIYYFTMDIKNHNKQKRKQCSTYPLAIIVLPEIRFHYKEIRKGKFDSKIVITTNTNDFIIWKFEQTIIHDVIRLRSNETFKDLISCHDRAIVGKSRRCLAINCKCIPPGAFFFCNPDFERVTGSYLDRLISTIIIDPPFSENSFIVTNKQFIPNILYITENDTVSWILKDNQPNHRIYVQSNESNHNDENIPIDRNIAEYVDGVYHLHTFSKLGEYIIKSNCFPDPAMVVVYSNNDIKRQRRKAQEPEICEDIYPVSPVNTQIHLDYHNHQNTTIYYTLNGATPTQHDRNVHVYDPNKDVRFREPGLHILRAYSTEARKLSSSITTSSPTFVVGNKEFQPSWNSCKLKLSGLVQHGKKIYGKVDIEPTCLLDLIDHIELYINDIAQRTIKSSTEFYFPVDGYSVDVKHQMHVVAYPKPHIIGAEPISSDRVLFEIKREIQDDTSSDSLAVSSEASTRFSMNAHIGVHVKEYTTLSTIEMIHQRSDKHDDDDNDTNNKSKKLKEHQQPYISTGASIAKIELEVNTIIPKLQERSKKITEEEVSNNFKCRAQSLLDKLTQVIENRSKELNFTSTHPHISYPGIRHYIYNQLLSERSSISTHEPYANERLPKSKQRS